MFLLIFFLLLSLFSSFICSIFEAVLLSITPSYIASMDGSAQKNAKVLKALKDDIDRPLAAILSLNTIAHTVGAMGVGYQANVVFGSETKSLFGLEIDLVLVISVVMTLAILFVSEIIPKTLGAMYWKRLGPLIAGPLNGLTWSLYPLVWLSQGLSQGLKKLFHADGTTPTLSRAEIRATADIAADEGVIDDQESHVLKNLLRFGSLQAKDIMTPRTVVVGFSEETTVAEFMETDLHLRHSRFPIYEETMDDVSGYVLKHDVLLSFAKDERDKPLSEVQREILVMPTFAKLTDLMEQMLARREHLAVLVGEYGGTAGIVTMEDLVETLLGMEIVDEVDVVEDMQALAREQWKVRAEKLGIDVDEVEAEESVHSKPDETTDEEGTD